MKIKAIIHPAEEGGYWAEVPALPGCITEGDTMEEVLTNLKDAIEGWLEVANSTHSLESNCESDTPTLGKERGLGKHFPFSRGRRG
jgi:predicted RNase H-like HicB family nuclease